MSTSSRDRVRARLVALAGTEADPSRHDRAELVDRVHQLVRDDEPLGASAEHLDQARLMLHELDGVGQLSQLLDAPDITDVMVNGDGSVWVEQGGVLQRTSLHLDELDVQRCVERIVLPLGLRADRGNPTVDARLSDGTRVHVVLPPLARSGPVLTFRRFASAPLPLNAFGGELVAALLHDIVERQRTVLVCGPTGSGKTTLVRALCHQVPADQRIVVVEDLAELAIHHAHCVELEARPPNSDGKGEFTMRDLLRNALRMRPDRLVIGEVRGAEAFDLLQALHTGHVGSMATLHANTCADALDRFEALVLLAGIGVSSEAVRRQINSAVHVVLRVERTSSGSRQVVEAVEVQRRVEHPLGRTLVDLLADGSSEDNVAVRLRPFRAREIA